MIDSMDLSALQQAADSMGADVDVKETILAVVSGETRLDAQFFRDAWQRWSGNVLEKMRNVLAGFLGPVFSAALFSRLFPKNSSAGRILCACGCILVFLRILTDAAAEARTLINGVSEALEAAVPLLTGLAAMGGGTSSAALLTPMATLAGEMMVGLIGEYGLRITFAAGTCACACALGSRFRLDGLFDLLKRTVQTGAGLILAVFAGILKVQGMLGASFDSAAVKTARFAVDKIVPVVGGGISDTMDAALSSVMLIKSAVGVTGMLIIAASCMLPVLRMSGTLIAIRLARAIAQPVADPGVADAAERFGDVIRMLVVLSITSVTISLILIGAAVGAGKSIG